VRPTVEPGEPVGKTRVGRDREEQLITVAARMFYDRGYDATTLQDVAEELGLLKGSLYYYIKSKDDLLYEVILRQLRSAMALLDECEAADGPPEERFARFIRGYVRSLDEDHIYVSVFLRELNRLSPERRKVVVDERKRYVDWVVGVVAEGQQTGAFRDDLDPTIACQLILGMLNSTYRWYRPAAGRPASVIIEELLKLVTGGILADGGKSKSRKRG
jgi:AcrR family transcriptional regulator